MATLAFIFIALPLAVFFCLLTPEKHRNITLFIINAAIWFFFFRKALPLIAICCVLDYFGARIICGGKRAVAISVYSLLMLKNAAGMAVLLYISGHSTYEIPAGFLVYAVTTAGYLTDIFIGEEKAEKDFMAYTLFATFFPKAQVGPIVTAREFFDSLAKKKMTLRDIGSGFGLFAVGLAKKILLADRILAMYEAARADMINAPTFAGSWITVLSFMFGVLCYLSGYSDMGRGVLRMFGIKLRNDYDAPYTATGVKSFFGKFNWSFSAFARRYTYRFICAAKGNKQLLKLVGWLCACIVWAAWFGIRLNTLVWGVALALVIVLESYWFKKNRFGSVNYPIRIYTFIVSVILFNFPAYGTLSESITAFGAMIGVRGETISDTIRYIFSTEWLVSIIGLVVGLGIFDGISKKLYKKSPAVQFGISAVFYAAIFALSVIFML